MSDLEGNINIGGQSGNMYPPLGHPGANEQGAPLFTGQQGLGQNTLDEPVTETIVTI